MDKLLMGLVVALAVVGCASDVVAEQDAGPPVPDVLCDQPNPSRSSAYCPEPWVVYCGERYETFWGPETACRAERIVNELTCDERMPDKPCGFPGAFCVLPEDCPP